MSAAVDPAVPVHVGTAARAPRDNRLHDGGKVRGAQHPVTIRITRQHKSPCARYIGKPNKGHYRNEATDRTYHCGQV